MGWREKANLLKYLLCTGLANKDNYEEVYKNFLEKTEDHPSKDMLTIVEITEIQCIPGWLCVEKFTKHGLPDNPRILQ